MEDSLLHEPTTTSTPVFSMPVVNRCSRLVSSPDGDALMWFMTDWWSNTVTDVAKAASSWMLLSKLDVHGE